MDKRSSFGIIAIVTTMLGAMLFSSCSHDDFYYSEDKVEQIANEKYAAAFEKAFGKVGPNVDWGFSSKNAGTRGITRAGGVAFSTDIVFPGDCDASNFLANWPENATKLSQYGSGPGSWYINEAYNMVQTYGGASKLYVKGNINLSEGDTNYDYPRLNLHPDTELYLLEGATLKIGQVSAERLVCAAIYIAEGATLTTDYPILLNSGMDVYNHGTINVKDLQVNTNSVLYNSSKVISTGTLSAESNGSDGGQSFIVNNGEIECKDVVVNGGAVLNILNWNVTATTEINSPNSGWINNGHWTTKDYAYVAGSENVINNCSLKVTRDFDMNISSLSGLDESKIGFKINSEGSVETENFYGGRDLSDGVVKGGPFKIRMAEYSLFKVNNKATLESGRGPMTAEEEGFGFFGPSTGGYAVFQAKDIVRDRTLADNNAHGAVTYSGNLYVSAETHFAQGNDGSNPPKWFIYERGSFSIDNNIYASGFKSGKPNITIEESDCSPGFKGGDPLYRVIAEDLSADQAGDFDFNDVVFDVVKYEGGKTTLRLQACGGTLPLKIGSTNGIGGVEVHSLYGESAPDATTGLYKMWNTSPTLNSHDPVDFEIDGQYTSPGQLLALRIEVQKEGTWMLLTATKGVAACKILVDDRFPIVPERTGIANKFGNFTKYVQGDWKENDGFWWIQE